MRRSVVHICKYIDIILAFADFMRFVLFPIFHFLGESIVFTCRLAGVITIYHILYHVMTWSVAVNQEGCLQWKVIPIFTVPTLHVSSRLAADNHVGVEKIPWHCDDASKWFQWVAGSALGVCHALPFGHAQAPRLVGTIANLPISLKFICGSFNT